MVTGAQEIRRSCTGEPRGHENYFFSVRISPDLLALM
jgi:hypothetical protein